MKHLFHYDSVQLEQSGKLARFVEGSTEPVTPGAAYAAWTAAESESAAAARQRMIDRSSRGERSRSAANGRARMIQRHQ